MENKREWVIGKWFGQALVDAWYRDHYKIYREQDRDLPDKIVIPAIVRSTEGWREAWSSVPNSDGYMFRFEIVAVDEIKCTTTLKVHRSLIYSY